MIKFLMSRGNGRVGLGMFLDKEEIESLQSGTPIQFFSEEMERSQLIINEIVIDYRETVEEALEFLKKLGAVDEETTVRMEKPPIKH